MARDLSGALPAEPDLLIGRDDLAHRIIGHLRGGARVVTLTGSAGVGKTTLALHTAWQMRRDLPKLVVRWVRMTSLPSDAEAEQVDRVVRDALNATDYGDRPPWDAITEYLRVPGRHTLLVLDNCEHIVVQAGEFIAALQATVPGQVTVLATSREPLGCVGEHVEYVRPLPYPREEDSLDEPWPALEMFAARADAFGHPLSAAERVIAAELVRSVDGLPLAIAIDAARLRYESLAEIRNSRLIDSRRPVRDRYPGLDDVGGRVNSVLVPAGLRQSYTGSYDRLDAAEKRVMDSLGVFSGGFDLPTAGQICSDGELSPDDVVRAVKRLVDRSLVLADTSGGVHRYRLLQSVRMFALEKINDSGDPGALRRRHLRYFRKLAAQYATTWFSAKEVSILEDARWQLGNFEAAMAYGLTEPELATDALAIAVHLAQLRAWHYWGKLDEGRKWLLKGVEATAQLGVAHPMRIVAQSLAAWIALCQGRADEARRLRDACIDAQRQLSEQGADGAGDDPFAAAVNPAVRYFDGAFRMLVPGVDDTYDLGAIDVLEQAAAEFAALGDRGGWAMSMLFAGLGAAFHFADDPARAVALTSEYLAACEAAGAQWAIVWARIAHAMALAWHADPKQAEALVHDTVLMARDLDDAWGTTWLAHVLVWVLAILLEQRRGDHPGGTGQGAQPLKREAFELARAWGAAEAQRTRVNVRLEGLGPFLRAQQRAEVIIRAALGSDVERVVADGRELDHRQAMLLRIPQEPAGFAVRWQGLPPDLKRIARLAALDWTNKEIGTEVHLSHRTIEHKLPIALHKLGLRHRKELVNLRLVIEALAD
ncbi:NB-ARC domain-containing protein [Amycolatopsis taiwanensis]|uniref:NB-ARC domain-containing protein n=1 Tax=Amycolatopsis taiwanensis TaxID=342230 RepID=UPI000487DBCF|nr:NB-ARC domain-containing protein [Amycolatopsis taiwanensis]